MKIETDSLVTLNNFGRIKGISRQRVYIMEAEGKIDVIQIDGVKFVLLNQKAREFQSRKQEKQ